MEKAIKKDEKVFASLDTENQNDAINDFTIETIIREMDSALQFWTFYKRLENLENMKNAIVNSSCYWEVHYGKSLYLIYKLHNLTELTCFEELTLPKDSKLETANYGHHCDLLLEKFSSLSVYLFVHS